MKSEIIAVEERLRQAMLKGNVPELDELIAEPLAFVIPGGMVAGKSMDLSAYRSGNQKVTRLDRSEQEILLFEDCAVVTVKAQLEGAYLGTAISGTYRYLRVWRKCAGNWQIIAGSVTPVIE